MSTLYDSTPNDPLTNINKARVDVSKLDKWVLSSLATLGWQKQSFCHRSRL